MREVTFLLSPHDVSFLLLIYFLVTQTLDPKEADLGMTLPTTDSSSASEVEIDQMTMHSSISCSQYVAALEEAERQNKVPPETSQMYGGVASRYSLGGSVDV